MSAYHPNRRNLLHAIPGAMLAAGSQALGADATLLSCYATESRAAAASSYRLSTSSRTSVAIAREVGSAGVMIGRSLWMKPDDAADTMDSPDTVPGRNVGRSGIWARRLSHPDRDLAIGIAAPPTGSRTMAGIPVTAGEAPTLLAGDHIDAVVGLSAGLGLWLGLHRIAPFFIPITGMETVERWHGKADHVAWLRQALRDIGDDPETIDPVAPSSLTERGIQVLVMPDARQRIDPA